MADLANTANSRESDSSEEGGLFSSLFVDETYVEVSYEFGDAVPCPPTTLLCSNAASTDHDLTGQVVWPVSIFLAWFVARCSEIFRGKCVLEVGAGCGLPGLVASRVGAATTLLTDGSDVVMRLLEKQCETHRAQSYAGAGTTLALPLEWGSQAGLDNLTAATQSSGVDPPSIVMGADVVCWPSCVEPLLQTTKALFLKLGDPFDGVLYVGYVCRAASRMGSTRDQLIDTARQMGFSHERIPATAFLPPQTSQCESGDLRKGAEEEAKPENDGEDGSCRPDQDWWPSNVQSRVSREISLSNFTCNTCTRALLHPCPLCTEFFAYFVALLFSSTTSSSTNLRLIETTKPRSRRRSWWWHLDRRCRTDALKIGCAHVHPDVCLLALSF